MFCCKTKEKVHDVLVKINMGKKGQAGVEEQLLRDFLEKSDVFELLESDGIHLMVMKKSANVIVKLLSVICETPCDLGEASGDYKKADVTSVC